VGRRIAEDSLLSMANYIAWANARLYRMAAALPDALYRKHVGAYFKSLQGTLNQVLLHPRITVQLGR
jgi:uncharacterized damage-inducible protein DinB